MMISIILENKNNEKIYTKLFKPGNEKYLIRDNEEIYPLLSQLDTSSFDVFSSEQMNQLIDELKRIQIYLSADDFKHVEEIVELALECKIANNLVLSFTPFDE